MPTRKSRSKISDLGDQTKTKREYFKKISKPKNFFKKNTKNKKVVLSNPKA
jgi:hypothetical protein